MSLNPQMRDMGSVSVDWQEPQIQFFARAGGDLRAIAAKVRKSTRQLRRYANAETPLPLHMSFAVAEAMRKDYRLINAYANDVNRILITKQMPRGKGAGMQVYMELLADVQKLGTLALKLDRGEPLGREEREEYERLCLAIQGKGALLEELGSLAKKITQ